MTNPRVSALLRSPLADAPSGLTDIAPQVVPGLLAGLSVAMRVSLSMKELGILVLVYYAALYYLGT